MILRSLLVTVLLFACWSVLVSMLPADLGWEAPLWNENLEAGQDFLYGDPPGAADIVVLGTSLADRLPLDSLAGRKVYPLTFGGQGVLDGLALLEATESVPGILLIETNLVNNPANESFAASLLHPVGKEVKRYFPALRQKNQPVTVLMEGLFYAKNGAPTAGLPDAGPDRPLNQAMLDLRRQDYRTPFPGPSLRQELADLRLRLLALNERGSRIVFFEVPVHPELCGAPRAVALRESMKEVFGSGPFGFFPQPDCSAYETTDGHHLRPASATAFAAALDERLRAMLR